MIIFFIDVSIVDVGIIYADSPLLDAHAHAWRHLPSLPTLPRFIILECQILIIYIFGHNIFINNVPINNNFSPSR
jgi:hypothetical protein